MTLAEFVVFTVVITALVAFGAWLGFDSGYDQGWLDHSKGRSHGPHWPWRREP